MNHGRCIHLCFVIRSLYALGDSLLYQEELLEIAVKEGIARMEYMICFFRGH